MKKLKEYMSTLSENVEMTKKEKLMVIVLAALAGCLLGMLISPRKNICCGNGNGNQNYYPDSWDEEEPEEE